MSKLRKLTRTWLRWAAEMEDKHGQPTAAGLAADMGLVEQERMMNQANLEEIIMANAKENLRLLSEIDDLEAKLSKMEEALLQIRDDSLAWEESNHIAEEALAGEGDE